MIVFFVLFYVDWVEIKDMLYLFFQIIGKIWLKVYFKLNYWWYVMLYLYVCGLMIGCILYKGSGFEIFYDMFDYQVFISWNDGEQ